MKEIYKIQTSFDGVKWKTEASFNEGDNSRFNKPFSYEVAKMEFESFNRYWSISSNWVQNQKRFTRSRLLIEVKN